MKKLMLFSLIGIVLLSCSAKKNESSSQDIEQAADVKNQVNRVLARDLYSNANEKIIKAAQYRFQVANVKKSQEFIEMSVRKYSAFISSSTLTLENPLLEVILLFAYQANISKICSRRLTHRLST